MVELLAKWLNEDVGLSKVSIRSEQSSAHKLLPCPINAFQVWPSRKYSYFYPNSFALESNQL